ncbi:VOC family protein [Nonomuraea sp. NPDC049152]|uniref:VOC family protein n=1 Tax=Nonomuraea sp. NPDC049152 TaxID=3154350 RepID=UPI0033D25E9F
MTLHHVEVWVESLDAVLPGFTWLFTRLGYEPFQNWEGGRSWRHGATYIVVEESPARVREPYDRMRPGLNHLAFHADDVDAIAAEAGAHGWRLMFADRHPHAGGPEHYAAYLENEQGFEVELVATAWTPAG